MRYLLPAVAIAFIGVLAFYPLYALTYSSGAPAKYTGGPGDVGTCVTCHSGSEINSGDGSVFIDAPTQFSPGELYTFTVTVDNTTEQVGDEPVQGFQVSAQDAEGNFQGQFIITDPDHTRTSPNFEGENYVTQNSAGKFLDTWTFDWVAPAEEDAPGVITLYVMGNAANSDMGPSGDLIYSVAVEMHRTTSNEPSSVPGVFALKSVYPNPLQTAGTIELEMEEALDVEITVLDGLGRVIRSNDYGILSTGTHHIGLSSGDLPSGLYFLRVITPKGDAVRPFTVVN